MNEPMAAFELSRKVTIPGSEIAPLLGLLLNDTKEPSTARDVVRRRVLKTMQRALGCDTIDDVVDKMNFDMSVTPPRPDKGQSFRKSTIDVVITRETYDAVKFFVEFWMNAKHPKAIPAVAPTPGVPGSGSPAIEEGDAILSGIERQRLMNLLERLEAPLEPEARA